MQVYLAIPGTPQEFVLLGINSMEIGWWIVLLQYNPKPNLLNTMATKVIQWCIQAKRIVKEYATNTFWELL